MWWIFAYLGPAVREFGRSQRGAAATRTGFVLAAMLGVSVVALSLIFGGGRAAPAPVAMSPVDSAMAELMALPMRRSSQDQTRARLERYADPGERTDAQLRNAHRTWARRVAEGSYTDLDLAADMAAITEAALRLRGLRPHPDS
jgi:hypothetical protein